MPAAAVWRCGAELRRYFAAEFVQVIRIVARWCDPIKTGLNEVVRQVSYKRDETRRRALMGGSLKHHRSVRCGYVVVSMSSTSPSGRR